MQVLFEMSLDLNPRLQCAKAFKGFNTPIRLFVKIVLDKFCSLLINHIKRRRISDCQESYLVTNQKHTISQVFNVSSIYFRKTEKV